MARVKLHAEPREVLGKEVKLLRSEGILPAHLYGKNVPSVALQVEKLAAHKVLATAGSSQLVDLTIKGEKKPRNVLIREVQKGLGGKLLHLDFFQVSMTEAITVPVPLELMGESPDLKLKNLTLDQMVWEVQVKCLPDRIPQKIDVDISSLVDAGQTVFGKDVLLGEGVTLTSNPEEVIARVRMVTVRLEEEVAKPAAEEVKAEGEAAPAVEGAKEEK
ncbi:MAG: 50S ribosomal protein L25 [Chloroflexi bacterium]|nr:50S ribosomal protein L25 [Chloroflexota bacterium]